MPFLTQSPEEEQVPYRVNKTNWKFLLIVVILAGIVGGGILWWQKSIPEPEAITILPQDETADWQAPESQEEEIALDTNCDLFPTKLDSCTKYKCQFIHLFTGETMTKEILGIIDGKCNYVEEMPNNGKLECKYTESMRKAAAQYYKDLASAESVGTEASGELGGEIEIKYTIDGKEVENPLQEALRIGQCVILGY